MDTLHTISKESKDLKGQEYLAYVTPEYLLVNSQSGISQLQYTHCSHPLLK